MEGMLKKIYGRDKVTNNSRDTVMCSRSKQQLLKKTIMMFFLWIKNLGLQFCIVKYCANPILNLSSGYKQAELTLLILQTQANYKRTKNKSEDMKHLRLFKPLLEMIIAHFLLTTHHHAKIN